MAVRIREIAKATELSNKEVIKVANKLGLKTVKGKEINHFNNVVDVTVETAIVKELNKNEEELKMNEEKLAYFIAKTIELTEKLGETKLTENVLSKCDKAVEEGSMEIAKEARRTFWNGINTLAKINNEIKFFDLESEQFYMFTNFNAGSEREFVKIGNTVLGSLKDYLKANGNIGSADYNYGLEGDLNAFFTAERVMRDEKYDSQQKYALLPAIIKKHITKTSSSVDFGTELVSLSKESLEVLKALVFEPQREAKELADTVVNRKAKKVIEIVAAEMNTNIVTKDNTITVLTENGKYSVTLPNFDTVEIEINGVKLELLKDLNTGAVYGGQIRTWHRGQVKLLGTVASYLWSVERWIEDNVYETGEFFGVRTLTPSTLKDDELNKKFAITYVQTAEAVEGDELGQYHLAKNACGVLDLLKEESFDDNGKKVVKTDTLGTYKSPTGLGGLFTEVNLNGELLDTMILNEEDLKRILNNIDAFEAEAEVLRNRIKQGNALALHPFSIRKGSRFGVVGVKFVDETTNKLDIFVEEEKMITEQKSVIVLFSDNGLKAKVGGVTINCTLDQGVMNKETAELIQTKYMKRIMQELGKAPKGEVVKIAIGNLKMMAVVTNDGLENLELVPVCEGAKKAKDALGNYFVVTNWAGKEEYSTASWMTSRMIETNDFSKVVFNKVTKTPNVNIETGEGLLTFEVNGEKVFGLVMPISVYLDKNNAIQHGDTTKKKVVAGSQFYAAGAVVDGLIDELAIENQDVIIKRLAACGYEIVRGAMVNVANGELKGKTVKGMPNKLVEKAGGEFERVGAVVADKGEVADIDLTRGDNFSVNSVMFTNWKFKKLIETKNGNLLIVKKVGAVSDRAFGKTLKATDTVALTNVIADLGARSFEAEHTNIKVNESVENLAKLEDYTYLTELETEERNTEVYAIAKKAFAELEGFDSLQLNGDTFVRVSSASDKISGFLPAQLRGGFGVVKSVLDLLTTKTRAKRTSKEEAKKLARKAVQVLKDVDLTVSLEEQLGSDSVFNKVVETYTTFDKENFVSVFSKQARNVYSKVLDSEYLGIITGDTERGTIIVNPKHFLGINAMAVRYPLTGLIGLGMKVKYDRKAMENMVIINPEDLSVVMGDTDGDMMTLIKISDHVRKGLQELAPNYSDLYTAKNVSKKEVKGFTLNFDELAIVEWLQEQKKQIRVNYDCTGAFTSAITKLAHVASNVLSTEDYRFFELSISKQFCQTTIAAKNSKHFTGDVSEQLTGLLRGFKKDFSTFTNIVSMGFNKDPKALVEDMNSIIK